MDHPDASMERVRRDAQDSGNSQLRSVRDLARYLSVAERSMAAVEWVMEPPERS